MNSSFIESLESRQLLSAVFEPAGFDVAEASVGIHQAAQAARVTSPNVRGTWNGSGTLDGSGDSMSLTMKISSQSGNRFSGTVTSRDDRGLHLRVSGQFTRGSSYNVSFSGSSSAGAVSGHASGKVSGRSMSGRGTFSASGSSYRGAFSLQK